MLSTLLTLCLSQSAAAPVLDLETAACLAAERALAAESAALTVERDTINQWSASRARLPSVTARVSGQGSLGRTFSEQLGANVTEPLASLSTGITASMPLYDGGAIRAGRSGAEADLQASEAQRAQTLNDLTWQSADGLLSIEQAEAAVAIQEAALEADRALLAQVEILVEAGSRTPADAMSQRAVVSSREASLAEATQALKEAKLSLLNLLRLDDGDMWTFESPPALPGAREAEPWVARALEQRWDLKAARYQIRAAQEGREEARAAFLPSASLGGGVATSWLSSDSDPLAAQLDGQRRTWVSVDLSVPLLDGGVRRAAVDTAEVVVREAELNLESLLNQVTYQIRLQLAAEEAALASLEATTSALKSAQQAADVLTLRYQAGAETLVSVTEARSAAVNAELERARAETALQRIRYRLAWTVGGLEV